MKRKGFTLVELLVVISIIALLMAILMPALAKVRALASRLVCGTNLSAIGKCILMYATDNEEEYPIAGNRLSRWSGKIADWDAPLRVNAFGVDGPATITSSFYLLVKYGEMTPKQFICKGDGAKKFELSDYLPAGSPLEYTDVWDFGDRTEAGVGPGFHCSYSYHMPYMQIGTSAFPIMGSSSPASPLCADRSPYCDENAKGYIVKDSMWVRWDPVEGYTDPHPDAPGTERWGNSAAHQREGQNVLFNDSHVSFERYPNVGIENDNIWVRWKSDPSLTPQERQMPRPFGEPPLPLGDAKGPWALEDAFLVNERN